MQRPRGFSSYSASSNETILEACSSSPYSTHTLGPADAVRFPLDPSIVPLPRALTSGPNSTVKTVGCNDDDVGRGKRALGEKEQEIESNNAAGNDDSEESIDWDAESDEDTANSAVAPQPRQVVKRAKLPRNMGFHFDWWIARIGTAAVNLDFKVLCASMMLWREKNEVLQVPLHLMRDTPRTSREGDNTVPNSALSQIPRPRSPAPSQLITADRYSALKLSWDVLLEDIRLASEQMHLNRKWRLRGMKNAAGWCRWGARQRIEHRGEFVEEPEVGYEVEREVDGRTWMIRLGYRRNDAVVDMDLDGEIAGADDTVAGEQGAGKEEAVQGTLNWSAGNNCHDLDVAMEEAPDP